MALAQQHPGLNFGCMVVLIAVLTLTAYSFVLSAPFKIMDDQVSIVENRAIGDFSNIKQVFTSGFFGDHTFYRPLVALSFMTEYRLFGLNYFFYNLDKDRKSTRLNSSH